MGLLVYADLSDRVVFVHAAYALADRMEALRLSLVGGKADEDLPEEELWDALIAAAADLRDDTRCLARLLDETDAGLISERKAG